MATVWQRLIGNQFARQILARPADQTRGRAPNRKNASQCLARLLRTAVLPPSRRAAAGFAPPPVVGARRTSGYRQPHHQVSPRTSDREPVCSSADQASIRLARRRVSRVACFVSVGAP